MDRVFVAFQITIRIRTKSASIVVACKRLCIDVHTLFVHADAVTPLGSKRASRMITGERSGSAVKSFQMLRYIGPSR